MPNEQAERDDNNIPSLLLALGDDTVKAVGNSEGSLKVEIIPSANTLLDIKLTRLLWSATLASPASIWDTTITMTGWHGFIAWDEIVILEWARGYQWPITSVATNVLTLWIPINVAYTTAADVTRNTADMTVVWSLWTPLIYSIATTPVFNINIHRLLSIMRDATAMDDGTFGGLPALTNWIVFRLKQSDWTFTALFNAKTNWDLALRAFDVVYSDKAPAWEFWLRFRRSFWWEDKNWSIIKLTGAAEFQMLVQDDLTGLLEFEVAVQWDVTF